MDCCKWEIKDKGAYLSIVRHCNSSTSKVAKFTAEYNAPSRCYYCGKKVEVSR